MGVSYLSEKIPVPFFGRVPIDRVVAGLLHVTVNHSSVEDDCNEEYFTNWGTPSSGSITSFASAAGSTTDVTSAGHGLSNADVVTITGTTSYNGTWIVKFVDTDTFNISTAFVADDATGNWYKDTAGMPHSSAMHSNPYSGIQPADPKRTGFNMSTGDAETFLFFVSGGVHLMTPDAGDYGTSYVNPAGYTYTTGTWYESITHSRCQSWIRSTLLARHSNSYDMPVTFVKNPVFIREWIGDGLVTATRNDIALLNNGVYNDDKGYFVKNLDISGSLNKWFSPVHDVIIRAKHQLTPTSNPYVGGGTDHGTLYQIQGGDHPITFYNLEVVVRFLSFDPDGSGNDIAFYRNRTNVFFQPFGETADIKFSTTEYTS